MTETPRPLQHLAQLMRRYPDLPHLVDTFRAGKGHDLPDWPAWCFVPFAAWHAVAMRGATPETMLERAGDIAILGALAPWRYTQGIYRFDADLLDALAETPLGSILPAGVFLRMPQWSVYIELPPDRFTWLGAPLFGFWASLEWDAGETNPGRHELRLLLDTDSGLPAGILHLGPWTVQESVRRAVAEAERNAVTDVMTGTPIWSPAQTRALDSALSKLRAAAPAAPIPLDSLGRLEEWHATAGRDCIIERAESRWLVTLWSNYSRCAKATAKTLATAIDKALAQVEEGKP